jgi:membrane protease YdiL (CAAX protease family)
MDIDQSLKAADTSERSSRITPILLIFFLIWSLIINNLIRLFVNPQPEWLQPIYYVLLYLLIAIFLILERKRLDRYFICRGSVIIFIVLGGVARIFYSNSSITFITNAVYWIPAALVTIFVYKKENFHKKTLPDRLSLVVWGLSGGLGTILFEVFMTMLIVGGTSAFSAVQLLGQQIINGLNAGDNAPLCFQFLYNLGDAPLWEEMIFRGFISGYLFQKGWQEKYVWLAQGLLFWFGHLTRLSGVPLFLFLPVSIFIFTFLCKSTKSIFPGVLAHTTFNTFVNLIGFLS